MIEQGALVFFQDPKHSWILGEVENWDGAHASCRPRNPKDGNAVISKLKEDQLFLAPADIIGKDVDDLLNLPVLHDSTLLDCLKTRYLKDVIYTDIGAIVVALNPFNYKIPWYMDTEMKKYLSEGNVIETNLPHSWAVAHNTYFELRSDAVNQSILVSGESGAGKTEASKIVMKYLSAISCKDGTEEQKKRGMEVGVRINLTSPPLEAFGNAKTVRNDNSSRFGKFMKVKFDTQGFLVGAHVTKYLLEKSRIVTAGENERCYHSLYLVCRGSDAPIFKTQGDSKFKVLTSGKCLNNKEFDTKEEYEEVQDAMSKVGLSDFERMSLWTVVASVLHLGNVGFDADGEGSVISVNSHENLNQAASLLCVDVATLTKELTTTTMTVGGQVIVKVLTPAKANDVKEALMKSMYDCAFQWLVDKCNSILDHEDPSGNWIGLLDIFGFEDFKINSFEQLCINLANEALQGHYNIYIFQKDLDECKAEGVDMSAVEFPDNAPCINMITGKGGVMALLDEECSLGKGSDMSFLEKVTVACGPIKEFFTRKLLQKSSFTVHHYAGSVAYEVEGFLDKNRDTLKDDLKLLIRSSNNAFLAELLPQPVESTAKKATVGGFFKVQLTQLMDILNSTNPHWIRCIKPHPAKKPLHWDGVSVMNQLASSGVLGTVKIRKAGYPVRMKVADFLAKYNILGKTVEAIFKKGGVSKGMGQKGTVRVFLKTESFQELERQKKTALLEYARTAQAFARALREFQTIAAKQREANKELYESLREKAVMLLELMDEETRVRAAIQGKLIRMKEDLKLNYDAKKVELEKEWRKVQVQRLREQYERKKREEAERAEEARLEKLRKEALERREREKKNREKELRDLERNAIEARMKRDTEELQMAIAAKRALEHALEQQASKVFQEREKKRIEDKQKRDAAALRRAKLSEEQSDKLKTIVQITEEQQKRGEIMKLKITFEEKQARERQRIKMEGRRREVAARLREEEEAKQRMLEMQVSIANAKSTFQQAQRSQIEKDNCARRHLQVVERFELDREVQLREELRTQREDRVRKADHGDAEKTKFEELLRGLEHRNTIQRREGDALVAPVYEYKSSAKTHDKITKITRSLQDSGQRVAAKASAGGGNQSSSSGARLNESVKCSIHKKPPTHIDPSLYGRVAGREDALIKKYGSSSMSSKPLSELPWRI